MTAPLDQRKPRRGERTLRFFRLLPFLCALPLMLVPGAETAEAVRASLALCYFSVIPSLFPFLVLSELLLRGGLGELLPRALLRPLEKRLSLSSHAVTALLLGWLCGFPVGARCLLGAREEGRISDEECERALLFCGIPSPAFLIGAVGGRIAGGRRTGVMLYALCVGVSLLLGLLLARFDRAKQKKEVSPLACRAESPTPRMSRLLTEAVGGALGGILQVCAYVLFFSAVSALGKTLLEWCGAPMGVSAIVASLLEISGGMQAAIALEAPKLCIPLAAFCAGWSGLSVHLQVLALAKDHPIAVGRYLGVKLLQGLLCALLAYGALFLFPFFG